MVIDTNRDDSQNEEKVPLTAQESSKLQNFYADSIVFITGATGFLGKLILEKLLRTCPDLKRIYILVRSKKGKTIEQRFEEIFDTPLFDRIKNEYAKTFEKISCLSGDCSLPNLGLNEKDMEKLIEEVDCIFHCAATVRFDAHIRAATHINIRAARDLIHIAKQMKNLRAMVHVSTAFSHCPRSEIDECFYNTKITGEQLLTLVDCLDNETLEAITPILIGQWPNTYVFTKAIAEGIIKKEGKGLAIAILRPSIVIATNNEPVPGWINNLYGPTGVLVGAGVGLLRSLYAKGENFADLVPADYVINAAIAIAWDIATTKSVKINDEKDLVEGCEVNTIKYDEDIPIYNYVSRPENPITWGRYMNLNEKHGAQIPPQAAVWCYCFAIRSNYYWHLFCIFFLHTIPAYIVDFVAVCIGKKPMLVESYRKIEKFSEVISYFSTRQWLFENGNVQALWKKLGPLDKKMFQFDMTDLEWDEYFYKSLRGARVYLLNDPLDTVPECLRKQKKLKIAHYTLLTIIYFVMYKIFEWLLRRVFNL